MALGRWLTSAESCGTCEVNVVNLNKRYVWTELSQELLDFETVHGMLLSLSSQAATSATLWIGGKKTTSLGLIVSSKALKTLLPVFSENRK